MPQSQMIRIATRQSRLALIQAQMVKDQLLAADPSLTITFVPLVTDGDRFLSPKDAASAASASESGVKGLFTKALETALWNRSADIAVHSLKDMPAVLPDGFTLGAILKRADARDALIAQGAIKEIAQLPLGARVGTASVRRQMQLLRVRPDLQILPLRGNIETRLNAWREGEYDAIVLAVAGLTRAGITDTYLPLDPLQYIPSPGQGAIAVECLADNAAMLEKLSVLTDPMTEHCVQAERALAAALGAGCHTPMGAYAVQTDNQLHLIACVGSLDGQSYVMSEAQALATETRTLGCRVAEAIIEKGGDRLLAEAFCT